MYVELFICNVFEINHQLEANNGRRISCDFTWWIGHRYSGALGGDIFFSSALLTMICSVFTPESMPSTLDGEDGSECRDLGRNSLTFSGIWLPHNERRLDTNIWFDDILLGFSVRATWMSQILSSISSELPLFVLGKDSGLVLYIRTLLTIRPCLVSSLERVLSENIWKLSNNFSSFFSITRR